MSKIKALQNDINFGDLVDKKDLEIYFRVSNATPEDTQTSMAKEFGISPRTLIRKYKKVLDILETVNNLTPETKEPEYIYTLSKTSLSVQLVSDKETNSVMCSGDSPLFNQAKEILLNAISGSSVDVSLMEELFALLTPITKIKNLKFKNLDIDVENRKVFYKDVETDTTQELSGDVCSVLFELLLVKGEQEAKPLLNFISRLINNPSYVSVNCIYTYVTKFNLEILEDGRILAWKKINSNWRDCFTNTIDNSIGQKPRLPRNKVDPDPLITCSYGLHVCDESYLAHYPGSITIRVAVCPSDIVAIPKDYGYSKIRTCGYEVMSRVE